MSDVFEYYSAFIGPDVKYRCNECFAQKYFDGNVELLRDTLEDETFLTLDGIQFDTVNENTVQYEAYPHQTIPVQGIYCVDCKGELYAPDESNMHKQTFYFHGEISARLVKNWVTKHILCTDVEIQPQKHEEWKRYALTFYTYEEMAQESIDYITNNFYVWSQQTNERVY